MFVVSVKKSNIKAVALLLAIAVFATIGGVYAVRKVNSMPVSKLNGAVMRAGNAEERLAFFSQFGWEVDEDPVEIKEVVIPTEFDDVYNQYNAIQKEQKLNLEQFKGARVKSYSYSIKNYPSYEGRGDIIHGNILVFNGVVIAGDICSTELSGFMHGFEMPSQQEGSQLTEQ